MNTIRFHVTGMTYAELNDEVQRAIAAFMNGEHGHEIRYRWDAEPLATTEQGDLVGLRADVVVEVGIK